MVYKVELRNGVGKKMMVIVWAMSYAEAKREAEARVKVMGYDQGQAEPWMVAQALPVMASLALP